MENSTHGQRDGPSPSPKNSPPVPQNFSPRPPKFLPPSPKISPPVPQKRRSGGNMRHDGREVYFRIGREAKDAAIRLRNAGMLPNVQEIVREIIRGDYMRLGKEAKQ